jgi:hypothetical protein
MMTRQRQLHVVDMEGDDNDDEEKEWE